MEINGKRIVDGSVFFIAEAGVNHNGDISRGKRLVDAAVAAGADAIKFQTFTTDRLVAKNAPKAGYQDERIGADTSQREMIEQYELSVTDHVELLEHCNRVGITFLSTPFDEESVDLLVELDVAAIKVGSGELTNHRLLQYIAQQGRPMIVSTGMATMAEVENAYDAIQAANAAVEVSLLHCVSAYPADMGDVHLSAMRTMNDRFPVPIGFSDHTTAVETPGFAVAAGATIIEKHVTLDRSLDGPDHAASLEPAELTRAVAIAHEATVARGSPEKEPVPAETDPRTVARKSLHAVREIPGGQTITADALSILRPATGLPPTAFESVCGRQTTATIEPHTPITAADIDDWNSDEDEDEDGR